MAKKNLTYAEKVEEIESILDFIETNPTDVDLLREKISRAVQLISQCKTELRSTEEEIQKLFDDDSK